MRYESRRWQHRAAEVSVSRRAIEEYDTTYK